MLYTSQDIRALRKSGDLQGAYKLAVDAHNSEPENRYITRELAWVLYDCLKRYRTEGSPFFEDGATYAQSLRIIVRYRLDPYDNNLFYEKLVRSVGSTAWNLARRKKVDDLWSVFEATVSLSAIDARFHNSILMKAFLKGFSKESTRLVDVIRWYGFDYFSREDYLDEEHQGKNKPGFAESMTNRYLGCLIKKDHEGNLLFAPEILEEAVLAIKPLIARPECAHWKWSEYKLGKLLLVMGRNSEARDILTPFVLRNPNEAYAWATYGETLLPEQPQSYSACIFHALELSNDPRNTLPYHEAAIELFAQMGEYGAAKREAEIAAKYRDEKGWPQSQTIQKAQLEPWYASAETSEDNTPRYRELGADAETTLEAYIPEVDFYLEWTAPEKGLAGIVTFPSSIYTLDMAERLCLHDAHLARDCEPEKVYKAALDKAGLRILGETVPSNNKQIEDVFKKSFDGVFEAIRSFGFVHTNTNDVWIPERLVEEYGLVSFARVKGLTVARFKRKKDTKDGEWAFEPRIIEVVPPSPEENRKEVEGTVTVTRGGYGFVANGYFIPSRLIQELDLKNGDTIRGTAVMSWDKRKRQWSWTVSEIIDHVDADVAGDDAADDDDA